MGGRRGGNQGSGADQGAGTKNEGELAEHGGFSCLRARNVLPEHGSRTPRERFNEPAAALDHAISLFRFDSGGLHGFALLLLAHMRLKRGNWRRCGGQIMQISSFWLEPPGPHKRPMHEPITLRCKRLRTKF